jgi:hypothetical protein
MTASEIRELKSGDRLVFRKWDSTDPQIRDRVPIEVINVVKRHYGPVLIARWNEDEVELRFSEYLGCLQHI